MPEPTGRYRTEVWREGDRIRREDGTGYSDRVSDDQIRWHAQDDLAGGRYDQVVFAVSALALRAQERDAASAAASSQRS
jgi:hypothetical protein